jgi:hypothetical protein
MSCSARELEIESKRIPNPAARDALEIPEKVGEVHRQSLLFPVLCQLFHSSPISSFHTSG